MSNVWSGHNVVRARAFMATKRPGACGKCGGTVEITDEFVVGHIKERGVWPELALEPSNWQLEHKACSQRTGTAGIIAKAKAEAYREMGATPPFSPEGGSRGGAHLPVSLSEGQPGPASIRDGLLWAPESLRAFPWLLPYLDVPENAAPPLAMTPPHPEAVGSYGAEVVEWIEARRGIELRWWQQLAMVRQLEHREDGSLCWRYVVESAPRRMGKSERLRSFALWRMERGVELFEPRQIVVHIARDLGIAREVQEMAWPWCESQDWAVTRGNGKEKVEHPNGARWLVKAKDAVYGFDGHAIIADECWDLVPKAISSGAEPAMRHRVSPQLVMTSTANEDATSLMPGKIASALAEDDDRTLLLLWAAPPGADHSDPAVWRAASAHWQEDEDSAELAASYRDAELLEPSPDNPEPLRRWACEYLNVWPRISSRREKGSPITTVADFSKLVAPAVEAITAAAIESWFEDGFSVSVAGRDDDGRAVVSSASTQTLAEAVAWVRAAGYRGRIIVGASLMDDPALKGVSKVAGKGRGLAAIEELVRLLTEDQLRHDGHTGLAEQVLAVRLSPGADGKRLVSQARTDAIKAAVWAASAARSRSSGSMRVLTARTV